MSTRNIILHDKDGNQLAPATIAAQVSWDSTKNLAQFLSKINAGVSVANAAADMSDTTKVYVYTGSETGYVNGSWYYYNGSAWVSGGVFGTNTTDKTLSVSGMAADAAAVGELKGDLSDLGVASASEKITQSYSSSQINIPDDVVFPFAIINDVNSYVTEIISRNKQLISFDGISVNGSGLTGLFSNNKITLNGNWSGQSKQFGSLSKPYVLKAGKTYTLSAQLISGTASNEINFNLCDASSVTILAVAVTNTKRSKTITPSENKRITQIGWGEYYGGATFSNAVYALQIEESASATDYVDAVQYIYPNPMQGQIIDIVSGGAIELNDSAITGASYDYNIVFYLKTKTIVVDANGTGDFTSLIDALNSVDENVHCRILIKEGIYNLSDEWTAEELSNADYPSGFYGTIIPVNCDLIGVGDREKIIITAEANDNYTWDDTWTHISTLNVKGGSTIENLTIRNKGMRYTIHHDFATAKNKTTNYINCIIDKWGSAEGHAIGAGSHDGEIVNIENCIIKPAMGWHGHNPATIGATLNIKNTIIDNLIQLTDYLTGYAMPINMVNVKCNAIRYIKAASGATQYMRINLHGCKCPVITTEDVVYNMDGVVYKMSSATIAKGKPVKRSNFNTVVAMGSSDSISDFYGVTMEEIPYTQYNVTDYIYGRVITEGYVSTKLLGLSGISVGDKIGISNGVFAVVESDAIGIIDYVVNSVGYMRILT